MSMRRSYDAAFDQNVMREIKEAYMATPLLLDFVEKEDETNGSDTVTLDSYSTLGTLQQKEERQKTPLDEPVQRYKKTITHLTYALGIVFSKEMQEDDKRRLLDKWARSLGASVNETINILAASLFNDGFSTLWGDGKALFATDHPSSGADMANTPSVQADLTTTTLAAGLSNLKSLLDHRGKKIYTRGQPIELITGVNNDKLATEITGSTLASGTANNDINYFRTSNGGTIYKGAYTYLTDDDAWFLQLPKHGLSIFMRVMPEFKNYVDMTNEDRVYTARFRASVGAEGWRGVYGSSGG